MSPSSQPVSRVPRDRARRLVSGGAGLVRQSSRLCMRLPGELSAATVAQGWSREAKTGVRGSQHTETPTERHASPLKRNLRTPAPLQPQTQTFRVSCLFGSRLAWKEFGGSGCATALPTLQAPELRVPLIAPPPARRCRPRGLQGARWASRTGRVSRHRLSPLTQSS